MCYFCGDNSRINILTGPELDLNHRPEWTLCAYVGSGNYKLTDMSVCRGVQQEIVLRYLI